MAVRHGAHLSRNARRAVGGGRHERFVTQRRHAVGRAGARAGLQVSECEEEFVVHGDRPALDVGWIEERPGSRA